jgi:K+-transporting ATPase ATPase C chain
MLKELRTNIILFLLLLLMTGFGYPMIILGIGQTFFSKQANGSLIEFNGKIIGSTLIGQVFSSNGYFHSRPSAAGSGYDATQSSGSNLGPTSQDLIKIVGDRVTDYKKSSTLTSVPVDLVTASASGLDPDISPTAARSQVARIASARNISTIEIESLVMHHTKPRTWDILGENRVNVLELNQALDHDLSPPASAP